MVAFKVLARNGVVGAGLLCALSTGAAIGASAGDEPAPKPSAVEDGNLLAGPKVTGSAPGAGDAKEGMRRDTLIERDFEGRIRRVETHPAIAALELIGLSDEEKAATSRIIAERDAVLDRAVQAHLKDLVQASNAGQSGDEAGALAYLRPIIDDTSELRERGRLLDELAGAVSKEHAQRLRQLHDEYWRAIVDERMTLGNPRKPDKKLSRFEAGAFETVAQLGQELRRSYERTVGLQARDFEALIAKLNLTPEQESKVRAITSEIVQRRLNEPSPGDGRGDGRGDGKVGSRGEGRSYAREFAKIYFLLDEGQRRVLMEEVRRQRGLPETRHADKAADGEEGPQESESKDEKPAAK